MKIAFSNLPRRGGPGADEIGSPPAFLLFTFRQGFVHPLQDVALHQCLPMSSVCRFPVQGGSPLPCFLLHGRPLDLFPLLGCHSVQRLVHLLFFILAKCPALLLPWNRKSLNCRFVFVIRTPLLFYLPLFVVSTVFHSYRPIRLDFFKTLFS